MRRNMDQARAGKAAESTLEKEHEEIFRVLSQLTKPLAESLPDTEVVVHDLTKIPNSIVAIAHSLTGRKPGDPATDMLLADAAKGSVRTKVNYGTSLSDGKRLRSTTIAVTDSKGNTFAALCINSDVTGWEQVARISNFMLGTQRGQNETEENFARSVNDLGDLILDKAIAEQGIPVNLMRKEHKLNVLRGARDGGVFLLRDAAGTVAKKLGISRFTVYNYLKELDTASGEQHGGDSNKPNAADEQG
jgi:predicted transcriptional regulator YheO